jgi:hypothetical protein
MRLASLGSVLVLAGLVAGCGSSSTPSPAAKAPAKSSTPKPAAKKTPTPVAKLTSADDVAACAQLEQVITAVSELVGHTTENLTQAEHPKELAQLTGKAQQSLVDSANLVKIVQAPEPLAGSQRKFEKGLRMFAADFGRAKASTAKGDMATATKQMTDDTALRNIQVAAKSIDDRCGD